MQIPSLWVVTALCYATGALAQGTTTSTSPTSASSAKPSCTASPITKLCDYPEPLEGTAVASSGREMCWEYCNAHQPCDFTIFLPGNPNTGSGTCWLYPGKTFDPKAGSTDCGNPFLLVDSKPVCSGGTPTSASGACAATASPSAVASICGYPPPETCDRTCIASGGAADCSSSCVKAEACAYAVFNPRNENLSPYGSGTCWIYTNGTFDDKAAKTCNGEPEQYVYNNVCPKPLPSSSFSSPSSPASSSSQSSSSPTGAGAANAAENSPAVNKNSASSRVLPCGLFAMFMAVPIWQGL